ncbi:hypothetical protein BH11PSE2_BH11PSE2_19790 [soil metagenome]
MSHLKLALAGVLCLGLGGLALAQPPQAPGGRGTTSLAQPKDAPPAKPTPPGPYAVTVEANAGLMTHTIYRPTDLKRFSGGKRLPIIAWGNGACSNAGRLFEGFLSQVASHGFLIIASGPKDAPLPTFAAVVPPGAVKAKAGDPPQPMTKDIDMQTALDWAIRQNGDKASPYFGRLNPDKIAVMGQSCGGLQAIANAGDPRVKTVVVWNSGAFPESGAAATRSMSGASKASLAKFHTPVAYINGGPSDVAYVNSVDDVSRIKGVPVFHGWINVGHGGTYNDPGAGWFGEVGVAWLEWRLNGDKKAARMFEGKDCTLCTNPIWHVENN